MTIDEAKASLKALCHTCKHFPTCVNDKPECFQAIEMAIKSHEAGEKVKEEIKVIRDRECLENDSFDEYSEGRYDVACECLRIIDKHLKEVEND